MNRKTKLPPVRDILERYALIIAWAAEIAIFGALRPDTFLSSADFSSILGTQVVVVVLTLGLVIPLTAGDYDLSIAANASLSAMLIALLNVNSHWAVVPAVLVALAAGAVVGAVNGGLAVGLGIDPFICTLGTGTFLQGIVFWISDSNTISGVAQPLVNLVVTDRLFGIPLGFYYGLTLSVIIWYVLKYTPLGRRLLIVGRGRAVARLNGINVSRVRFGAFVVSGLVAALAGVVLVASTGAADPSSANSFLLPAYAAAFLGATAITPGRFNAFGALFAVYFLATGITGLQLLGVQSFVQQLFYGGALIVAVALSRLASRRHTVRNE